MTRKWPSKKVELLANCFLFNNIPRKIDFNGSCHNNLWWLTSSRRRRDPLKTATTRRNQFVEEQNIVKIEFLESDLPPPSCHHTAYRSFSTYAPEPSYIHTTQVSLHGTAGKRGAAIGSAGRILIVYLFSVPIFGGHKFVAEDPSRISARTRPPVPINSP